MSWILIVAFAFSSSIDNLGVGISYGIRKIQIRLFANFIMAFICFLMSEVGITFGLWLSKILPGIFPILAGAFLLIIIGIRIILLAVPREKEKPAPDTFSEKSTHGLTRILKNPESADRDKSGEISWVEAIVLGIALSANALTNGLGAGLLGFSPLIISLTAACGSFISVWVGIKLGYKLSSVRIGSWNLGQFGTIISGVIIVIIAIGEFFHF